MPILWADLCLPVLWFPSVICLSVFYICTMLFVIKSLKINTIYFPATCSCLFSHSTHSKRLWKGLTGFIISTRFMQWKSKNNISKNVRFTNPYILFESKAFHNNCILHRNYCKSVSYTFKPFVTFTYKNIHFAMKANWLG